MTEQTGQPPAPSNEVLRASSMSEATAELSMAEPGAGGQEQSVTVTAFRNGIRLT